MGRYTFQVNTSADQVNTAWPAMKLVAEYKLTEDTLLVGALFSVGVKNADTSAPIALAVGIPSGGGSGDINVEGSELIMPPLIFWNEVNGRVVNIFFGQGEGERMNAGQRIALYASGPSVAATKLTAAVHLRFAPVR